MTLGYEEADHAPRLYRDFQQEMQRQCRQNPDRSRGVARRMVLRMLEYHNPWAYMHLVTQRSMFTVKDTNDRLTPEQLFQIPPPPRHWPVVDFARPLASILSVEEFIGILGGIGMPTELTYLVPHPVTAPAPRRHGHRYRGVYRY